MRSESGVRRRTVLAAPAAAAFAGRAAGAGPLTRPIPASGERLPAIGLGTWLTFDVALDDAAEVGRRGEVLRELFAGGGALIDSSPMYGRAERLVGQLLRELPLAHPFSAAKVWTPFTAHGALQMEQSLRLWGLTRCDLMQVHNLLNVDAHLKTLRRWKDEGRARYIGITTSHGRGHDEVERLLRTEPLDFLQITYSPADRSAEPVIARAAERGVAVIANRPFDGGALLHRLRHRRLPAVARELEAGSWAALVLKWELAHPAVTCAIPATTNPAHCAQNLAALQGPLPDARQRARILEAIAT